MSKNITKEQLLAALQLLLDELDPKDMDIRNSGVHVLDFDKSYIANTQIENRGHWIEHLIEWACTRIRENYEYRLEDETAAELDLRKPTKWSQWYTPVKPEVSIFQVLDELSKKKAVLEIDYVVNISGAYRVDNDDRELRVMRYLDFGDLNWRKELITSNLYMDSAWIDHQLETVNDIERSSIRAYISRYTLGFISYLSDASIYNMDGAIESNRDSMLCINHILGVYGVYANKKPERSVSVKINAIRAYDPLPENIDLHSTDLYILRFNRPGIRYAILNTICQYSHGCFMPHNALNAENGQSKG